MGYLLSKLIKPTLNATYFTRLHKLAQPMTQGEGAIFMLHQVNREKAAPFHPNHFLTITPEYLESVIQYCIDQGYDLLSMDEVQKRLLDDKHHKKFVSFTLDDGYRDNLEIAHPIFKKYNVPYMVYLATDYCSGKGELWWVALERIVSTQDHLEITLEGKTKCYQTNSVGNKLKAFDDIYKGLRRVNQFEQRTVIKNLAETYDFDLISLTRELILSWDELRTLKNDPLVSFGAHTKSHFALKTLTPVQAIEEVQAGLDVMERELGEIPRHFAYPYGDETSADGRDFELIKSFNFLTCVTTRKGLLFRDHKNHLTALPRLSLNGYYQKQKYTEIFLSGLPFALFNRFRTLNCN